MKFPVHLGEASELRSARLLSDRLHKPYYIRNGELSEMNYRHVEQSNSICGCRSVVYAVFATTCQVSLE